MSAPAPRRGEIYMADLNPVIGSEQGGRRPVLVIQNDIGNRHSPVTIVAAITSAPTKLARPTDVPIPSARSDLPRDSRVLLNQVKTIDKQRLERCVGELQAEHMALVDDAIRISLGLVPL